MVISHWKDVCWDDGEIPLERCLLRQWWDPIGKMVVQRWRDATACLRAHAMNQSVLAGQWGRLPGDTHWKFKCRPDYSEPDDSSALLHSSCRCWPVLSDIESRWSGPRWWLMSRHHNSDYMIIARMMKIIWMIFAMEMLSWWLFWKAFVSDVRSCQNHANHTHFNTSILLKIEKYIFGCNM